MPTRYDISRKGGLVAPTLRHSTPPDYDKTVRLIVTRNSASPKGPPSKGVQYEFFEYIAGECSVCRGAFASSGRGDQDRRRVHQIERCAEVGRDHGPWQKLWPGGRQDRDSAEGHAQHHYRHRSRADRGAEPVHA